MKSLCHLAVVRVGVEGVEGPGSTLRSGHVVVVQRHVDLRGVLANIVPVDNTLIIVKLKSQSLIPTTPSLVVFFRKSFQILFSHLSSSQSASLNLTMLWSSWTQFSSPSSLLGPGSPCDHRSRVSSAPE